MNRICFSFSWLLALLFLFQTDSIACGREYLASEKIPTLNAKLPLESLLQPSPSQAAPYWFTEFGADLLNTRNDLFSRLTKEAGGAKITDAGIDSLQVIALALDKDLYQLLSDYALIELKTGNRARALDLLEKLQTKHPDEYNINANLSLAFELNGNLSKALEYLEKAIAINSRYGFNSEWIHLNLLREKAKTSPDYSAIIGLKNADFAGWFNKPEGFPRDPDSLQKEIAFQVHERLPLFGMQDEAVSRLILDFSDIVAKQDGGQAALPFYALLVKLQPASAALVEKRLDVIRQKEGEIRTTFRWASLIWIIPLTLFVLFFAAWINSLRRNRKEKQKI